MLTSLLVGLAFGLSGLHVLQAASLSPPESFTVGPAAGTEIAAESPLDPTLPVILAGTSAVLLLTPFADTRAVLLAPLAPVSLLEGYLVDAE